MSEAGRKARGLYITPMYLFGMGAERTAAAVSKAHLNAVVIDMKDDNGNLVYPTRIPLGEKQRYLLIQDPAAWCAPSTSKGSTSSAAWLRSRTVVCHWPARPGRAHVAQGPAAVLRRRPLARRLFPEVQDYLIDIALELQGFGFDEVQFDYVRFPKGHAGSLATWLHQGKRSADRSHVIAGFLERADRALSIPSRRTSMA